MGQGGGEIYGGFKLENTQYACRKKGGAKSKEQVDAKV